jgi:hypothetical protein
MEPVRKVARVNLIFRTFFRFNVAFRGEKLFKVLIQFLNLSMF